MSATVHHLRDDDASVRRTLPNNIDAEQRLLGALLVENERGGAVAGFLEPEHFFEHVHGRIYEAVAELVERG